MKKIININFHGRVVPIEETAYDILKQYVDSLRTYFAKEEGRDEIINDIENRFAELFSESLKKGSTCITDEDVNTIITSMGRPEDFDEVETEQPSSSSSQQKAQSEPSQGAAPNYNYGYTYQSRGRLYRNEDDRLLGGVCSGLGSYFNIDPVVMRIIFIVLAGFLFWVYIVLWIVVPSRSLAASTRKRLFRNPDDRVIGGVAGGLAAYFHMDVWIWRVIFALPIILGTLTSVFRRAWFDFDFTPVFFTGGLGGTLIITYIILWAILPEASTASEKLEMRGEKVDLESIKNTIKSDLEGFKGRARDMGNEVKERAQAFSREVKQSAQNFSAEAGPTVRRTGSGLGHAIGVLFKAFFLFIAAVIAFGMIVALAGFFFSGVGLLPLSNFLLDGYGQRLLGWASLFLFFGIPVIALLTWLIRRIMGARSRHSYLGYMFGSLWVIGLICLIVFVGTVVNNFRSRASVEDEWNMSQPAHGKLIVKVNEQHINYYESDWFGFSWGDKAPFYGLSEDSVNMTTVRVNLIKSPDSLFHIQRIRFSHGRNPLLARNTAGLISFDPKQSDSVLYLPSGFTITPKEKFRNQQVLLIVAIPLGKKIMVDRNVDDYHWFDIKVNRYNNRGWNIEWNDDWDNTYNWSSNVEYVMTDDGLKRTDRVANEDSGDKNKKEHKEKDGYRYKGKSDSTGTQSKDLKTKSSSNDDPDESSNNDDNKETLITPITNRFEAGVTTAAPLLLSVLFQ